MKLNEAIDKYGSREIDEEKLKGLFKPVEPIGRFKPGDGDTYFIIGTTGSAWDQTWRDNYDDDFLYRIGNCFPTKKAAEFAIEKQKFLMLIKDYAGRDGWTPEWPTIGFNWRIYYDHSNKELEIELNDGYQTGDIYFQSESDCQHIIDNYHDELLKYYFEVER